MHSKSLTRAYEAGNLTRRETSPEDWIKKDAPWAGPTFWPVGWRINGRSPLFRSHTSSVFPGSIRLVLGIMCLRIDKEQGAVPPGNRESWLPPHPLPDPGRALTDKGGDSPQARCTGIFCILPPCTDLSLWGLILQGLSHLVQLSMPGPHLGFNMPRSTEFVSPSLRASLLFHLFWFLEQELERVGQ